MHHVIYEDEHGEIDLFAEPMGAGWAVYFDTVTEVPGRSRAEVQLNVGRAFDYAGLVLIPS